MAESLNWGILGTARINEALIPPLRSSKRNKLLAVGSRDGQKAKEYAQRWSIPKAYGSYEALLADPEISVIYISLPNSLHAEWTIKAAEAGKNVLCEKPLAIHLEEVDAVREAAKRYGVVVQEAFMYRHVPQTLKISEMIRGGILGKTWLVRGSFRFNLKRPSDVRFNPDLGGGSLWDVGCYPLSYSRMVLGAEPEEVIGWHFLSDRGVDLSFAGQLRFPNQAIAQIDSSFVSEYRAFMEIVGTEASLVVPTPFRPQESTEIFLRKGGQEEVISFPKFDLYSGEIENMADAILDGKPTRVSLEDSRANVQTILSLLESARTGKAVAVGGNHA